MTPYLRDIIRIEAEDCRHDIEIEADRFPLTSCQNDGSLRGWCAIATGELVRRLGLREIKSEIHMWNCPRTGHSHVFPVVEDHIVDITGTQFPINGDETVIIRHHREINPKVHWFWETSDVYATVEDLLHAQKRGKWPKDQWVRTKMIARNFK